MKYTFFNHSFFSRQLFLGVFFIALSIRILWFFVVLIKNPQGFMLHDSFGYWELARNLELNGLFSLGNSQHFFPDSTRTPFYPFLIFFLNKISLGIHGIILFQMVLSSAICSLCAFITFRIFGNFKASLFAGILACFDFPSVFFCNTIMTETVFSFLLIVSVLFFINYFNNPGKRTLVISAILLGFAILCRPIAIFLPLIYIILIWGGSCFSQEKISINHKFPGNIFFPVKKLKPILLFLFFSYLIICPWVFRNYLNFGSPFLSTIGDINLWSYTSAAILAEKENKTIFQIQDENLEFSKKNFNWNNSEEIVRFAKYCREESFRIILENPYIFIKNQLLSFMYFFTKPLRNYIDYQLGITQSYQSLTANNNANQVSEAIEFFKKKEGLTFWLVLFQVVLTIAIACLVSFLLFKWRKKISFQIVICLIIILYFALMSSFTEMDARMRVPVIPLLCILAGGGLSIIIPKSSGFTH